MFPQSCPSHLPDKCNKIWGDPTGDKSYHVVPIGLEDINAQWATRQENLSHTALEKERQQLVGNQPYVFNTVLVAMEILELVRQEPVRIHHE